MPITRAQLNYDLISVLTPIIDVPQHHHANWMILDYVDQQIGTVTGDTWTAVKSDYYTKSQVNTLVASSASTLSQHQVGVGNTSNQLSGSNYLTWNGATLNLQHPAGSEVTLQGTTSTAFNIKANGNRLNLYSAQGIFMNSDGVGKVLIGSITDQGNYKMQIDGGVYINGGGVINGSTSVNGQIAGQSLYLQNAPTSAGKYTVLRVTPVINSQTNNYDNGIAIQVADSDGQGSYLEFSSTNHVRMNSALYINHFVRLPQTTSWGAEGGGATYDGAVAYRPEDGRFYGFKNGYGDYIGGGFNTRGWKPFLMEGDVAGGGSVSTLQQVTDAGNTTTNNITVGDLQLKDLGMIKFGSGAYSLYGEGNNTDFGQTILNAYGAAASLRFRIGNQDKAIINAGGNLLVGTTSEAGDAKIQTPNIMAFNMSLTNKLMGKTIIGDMTDQGNYNLQVDGSLYSKGYLYLDAEGGGIIVDAGGDKRIGLMKYAGYSAGFWRVKGQDLQFGRINNTYDLTASEAAPETIDLRLTPDGAIYMGSLSAGGAVNKMVTVNNGVLGYQDIPTGSSYTFGNGLTNTNGTISLGDSSLDANITFNGNYTHSVDFNDLGGDGLTIEAVGTTKYGYFKMGGGFGDMFVSDATVGTAGLTMGYGTIKSVELYTGGGNATSVTLDGTNGKVIHHANKHVFKVANGTVPEYADNATALAAGLEVGTVYRTGDLMKIVH